MALPASHIAPNAPDIRTSDGRMAGAGRSGRRPHILVVEDDPSMVRAMRAMLAGDAYDLEVLGTGGEALAALSAHAPDLVLLDLHLPDMHGFQVLEVIRTLTPRPATVVITAESSVETAVEAMRRDALDFVPKPFSPARVLKTVHHALESVALRREMETIDRDHGRDGFGPLVGASPAMLRVYRMIEKVASSSASVFITGESGTGKDVVARAIHDASPRVRKAFVPLNCGAIPKDLMESELFGHVKGAFTGATADRPGAARKADGGTLFLDELGEMDINLQSKLLRFIQTGDVQAVGANDYSCVNVRFICATNRDADQSVADGLLREDLYYRLNVLQIHLPPLRERGEDILTLARHFLRSFSTEEGKAFEAFDGDAEAMLMSHSWPGNVREMQNVIRRIIVLNDGETVTRSMLPQPFGRSGAPVAANTSLPAASRANRSTTSEGIRPLWLVEKEAIEEAVETCAGNVVLAAAHLGINPSTIYRKRQQWQKAARAAE